MAVRQGILILVSVVMLKLTAAAPTAGHPGSYCNRPMPPPPPSYISRGAAASQGTDMATFPKSAKPFFFGGPASGWFLPKPEARSLEPAFLDYPSDESSGEPEIVFKADTWKRMGHPGRYLGRHPEKSAAADAEEDSDASSKLSYNFFRLMG